MHRHAAPPAAKGTDNGLCIEAIVDPPCHCVIEDPGEAKLVIGKTHAVVSLPVR